MEEKRGPEMSPALPCACASLRRAARAVTVLYDKELSPGKVRGTQFTFLQALAVAGEITQGRLAQMLVIDSTTLTRSLALLRRRGWIVSRPGPDRRERLWRLRPAGRRELEHIRPHWERAQRKLRLALGQADWESLLPILARVARAAAEP